jgi:hypothetical protein
LIATPPGGEVIEGRIVKATGPQPLRAIVHVGTHKTGTTAFQQYVDRWREELLRDHGVLVHRGLFLPSHLELPALVIRPELATPDRWLLDHQYETDADTLKAAIRTTVESNAPTVLFSAEGLSFMRTDEEALRLRQLLAPRAITPVVVLRKPADYLRAFRVSHSRWFSRPSSDPSSVAYWEPDSWLAGYDDLRASLQLIGSEAHAIDYDEEMATSGTVIPALMRSVGVPMEDLYAGWDAVENTTQYEG